VLVNIKRRRFGLGCELIECKNKESEEQNEGINTKLFLDLLLVEAKENFV
jgi:hypothetical protein